MTYRELLRALERAKELTQMQDDIPCVEDFGDQKSYVRANLAEHVRLGELLDEEIPEAVKSRETAEEKPPSPEENDQALLKELDEYIDKLEEEDKKLVPEHVWAAINTLLYPYGLQCIINNRKIHTGAALNWVEINGRDYKIERIVINYLTCTAPKYDK